MRTREHRQQFGRRARRGRSGMTLVEVIIASSISALTLFALVQTYVMVSRFSAEGMREVILLSDGSMVIDQMSRRLNGAYRLDAETASLQFQIQDSFTTIEFSVPDEATSSDFRERFRYDSTNDRILWERRNGSGTFVQVGNEPLLDNVAEFSIDNQEGILSMVVRLEFAHNYYGTKRYTLIGRALPRNI